MSKGSRAFRFRALPLLIAAGAVLACQPPRERALGELRKRGIEPTGRALLEAVERGDRTTARWLIQAEAATEARDAAGRTPLHLAIRRRDSGVALQLLEAGAVADARAADGGGVLGEALAAGDPTVIERLLAKGAQFDGRMPDGEEILPWAIRTKRTDLAKRAIAGGADATRPSADGTPLLCLAMKHGQRGLLMDLLEKGAPPVAGPDGRAPLHHALEQGWLEVVPALVKAGADPNAPDPASGRTPLAEAVHRRDAGLLQLVLSVGADPNRCDPAGETPLHAVLRESWPEARRLLAEAGADFDLPDAKGVRPLERALAAGDWPLTEELAGCGARAGREPWRAALWQALARRDAAALRSCLRLGADPAATDGGGRLPMEWAALAGEPALAHVLLDAGAPPGDALYLACRAGDRAVAGLMLAGGVSPNRSRAPWLDTPLCAAIRAGDDELVRLLLAKGAHPFLRGAEGQPPMVLAIARRRPASLATLLARGADPNAPCVTPARPEFLKHVRTKTMRWVLRNDRNVTPLMLAASTGETKLALLLLAAGAKTDVTTRTIRYWPINFASSEQDVPMMRVLLGQDPHHEERKIVISLTEQRARVFSVQGEEIFSTKVSTGRTGFGTPPGEYVITSKHRDWKSTLYHAKMPFFQRLSCGDFGLHEGVVPGYPASHGCIRVPSGNAQKLYTLTKLGDRVRIEP